MTILKDADKITPASNQVKADLKTKPATDVKRDSAFFKELQKLIDRHFTQDAAIKVFEQFLKVDIYML